MSFPVSPSPEGSPVTNLVPTASTAKASDVKLPEHLSKSLFEATIKGSVEWSHGMPIANSMAAFPICLQAQSLLSAQEKRASIEGRVMTITTADQLSPSMQAYMKALASKNK